MYTHIQVQTSPDMKRFCKIPGLPPLDSPLPGSPTPDARWMLADSADRLAARCSLWWQDTPAYSGRKLGLIGHYAAQDRQAGAKLLDLAAEMLAAQGCELAVGPMDGNAWQPYRLVIEHGSEPAFFLEPSNPQDWPSHFRESGFGVLEHYSSALNPDLSRRNTRREQLEARAAAHSIEIRQLNPDDFEGELRRIYSIACASFRSNLFFSRLGLDAFLAQYAPIRPHLQPALVQIAEQAGHAVGFVFALPDLLQASRGKRIDTMVVKTLAVLPQLAGEGLGSLLVERCQQAAYQAGYQRAIHALMREDNHSRRISNHYAQPMRRYALFGREL